MNYNQIGVLNTTDSCSITWWYTISVTLPASFSCNKKWRFCCHGYYSEEFSQQTHIPVMC